MRKSKRGEREEVLSKGLLIGYEVGNSELVNHEHPNQQ